jgi:hypothetical protein
LFETSGSGVEGNCAQTLLMLHDEKYHQSNTSILKLIKEDYSMMVERPSRL